MTYTFLQRHPQIEWAIYRLFPSRTIRPGLVRRLRCRPHFKVTVKHGAVVEIPRGATIYDLDIEQGGRIVRMDNIIGEDFMRHFIRILLDDGSEKRVSANDFRVAGLID